MDINKAGAMLVAVCCLSLSSATAFAGSDGKALFAEKCTTCHALNQDRMGPSVINMNKDAVLLTSVIADGMNGSLPMPAFGEILKPEQIDALVIYIKSQPE